MEKRLLRELLSIGMAALFLGVSVKREIKKGVVRSRYMGNLESFQRV